MILAVLMFWLVGWSRAEAQIPYVQTYFDPAWNVTERNCPDVPGALDTLYVVAHNFGAEIVSIEYLISYPGDNISWLGDIIDETSSVEGSSPAGIRIHFSPPAPMFEPTLVQRVLFLWNCYGGCPIAGQYLIVRPHPESNKVLGVRWPDLVGVEAVGMTSSLCITLGVETRTWGGIKALYE
jgi:hypothetical protein